MYAGLYEVVACWIEAGMSFQCYSNLGKSGYDVIRFAFKRLPGQAPLVNGKGEPMPEPDYESEEWKGWEVRMTDERAGEVVAIKKEESPMPEGTMKTTAPQKKNRVKIEIIDE
jgi:hypothetical protein